MKVFIWESPYKVNYGHSMVFAVAETLEDAKEQAKAGKSYSFGRPKDHNREGWDFGEPTRVIDAPCAECHEWQE